MNLGAWQLDALSGGTFRLDGGAMFGVVPKPLWEKRRPADAQNRIEMIARCVLARDGEHTLLIDTGYGGKADEQRRERSALESGAPLEASLAAVGLAADDIDTVVLTHLHFDHAGGSTRFDEHGDVAPAFRRARYIVQQAEWDDATSDAPELRGSYITEDFLALRDSGLLELVHGDVEIVPGLRGIVTNGHTRGHMAMRFDSGGQTALLPVDICPTADHLPALWGMAYDTAPLITRRIKPRLLGQAADEGWLVVFDHDVDLAACRLARDPRREFVITERYESL